MQLLDEKTKREEKANILTPTSSLDVVEREGGERDGMSARLMLAFLFLLVFPFFFKLLW